MEKHDHIRGDIAGRASGIVKDSIIITTPRSTERKKCSPVGADDEG